MWMLARIQQWQQKQFALLVTLVVVLLAQPLAGEFGAASFFYDFLSTVVVLAVLLVVFDTRADRIAAMWLALPGVACNFARYAVADGPLAWTLELAFHAVSVLFYGFAAGLILRSILERRAVLTDDVLGALCSYLLLGLAWANLYQIIVIFDASAFSLPDAFRGGLTDRHVRQGVFNYFSFVTLTTLGYGDVTPVSHLARTLSWLQATFGQFYIAVVVAQIVSLRMAMGPRVGSGSAGTTDPEGDEPKRQFGKSQ